MAANEYLDKAGLKRLVELLKGELAKVEAQKGDDGKSIHFLDLGGNELTVGQSMTATFEELGDDVERFASYKTGDLVVTDTGALIEFERTDTAITLCVLASLKGEDGTNGTNGSSMLYSPTNFEDVTGGMDYTFASAFQGFEGCREGDIGITHDGVLVTFKRYKNPINTGYYYYAHKAAELKGPYVIEDGSGTGAVQQVADGVADGFNFAGKNANAEQLDPTLSAVQPYGAVGNYSSAFGGKSSAQGKRSHAEGTTTIAKGNYSHAEGDNSVSLGADSHAEGYATTAAGTGSHTEGSQTVAKGAYSHAEGIRTVAVLDGAHAEGCDTVASGEHSHAEGNNTEAGGTYSHAEGARAKTTGTGAHAEGLNTTAGGSASHAEGCGTVANGAHSHAEGYGTTAEGDHSHAEGHSTNAKGAASHAEGSETVAKGDYSHAGGLDSTASGYASFAHGQGVSASGTASAAVGRYNKNNGDNLFEVGNGTSNDDRSNAFEVCGDGRAKVHGAPKDKEDVVRLVDLDGRSESSIHYTLVEWLILKDGTPQKSMTLLLSNFEHEPKVGDLCISQNGILYKVLLVNPEHAYADCEALRSLKGTDGKDGTTPHIGENGNWWIGETDTGVAASPKVDLTGYATEEYVDKQVGDINTALEAILGV